MLIGINEFDGPCVTWTERFFHKNARLAEILRKLRIHINRNVICCVNPVTCFTQFPLCIFFIDDFMHFSNFSFRALKNFAILMDDCRVRNQLARNYGKYIFANICISQSVTISVVAYTWDSGYVAVCDVLDILYIFFLHKRMIFHGTVFVIISNGI